MTWRSVRLAKIAALVLCGVGLSAAPATASLAYRFHKTGSNPADLQVAIAMSFGDAGSAMAGTAFGGGFDGLDSFVFRIGSIEVDLRDLTDVQARCAPPGYNPACQPFTLAYDLAPEAGFMRFNNQSFDFTFSYGAAMLAGDFNSDGPSAPGCQRSGTCRYEGEWLPIPEPLGAGLLAAGLAGIVAAHARRRRTVAAPA